MAKCGKPEGLFEAMSIGMVLNLRTFQHGRFYEPKTAALKRKLDLRSIVMTLLNNGGFMIRSKKRAYHMKILMEPPRRFELRTSSLRVRCSAN